ncbi:hypothetical protein [Luteimonas sp. R10]|uniref:hypothetical protein n=1 Tax=Luteimonas sp. R10 TaxID=3108176 RepID=UPI003089158C|nr:hypothetical protein U3649_01220 [Luteimonas sp. R10]
MRSAVPVLASFFVLLAGCAGAGTSPPVEGVYAMPDPALAELRVVALPGDVGAYRVEVHGAGDAADGAAIGADCYAVAEGTLENGRLRAGFVPFESLDLGFDARELAERPRTLELAFDGEAAVLSGDFDYCPLRTVLDGRYLRTGSPQLLTDCPPLPQACWNRE